MDAVEARNVGVAVTRYEAMRENDGGDPDLLAHIASLVLLQAAISGDEAQRSAAIAQLGLAGTAAVPALEEITEHTEAPAARARALGVLAQRDHGHAESELYALLDSQEPAALAEALRVADPIEDRPRLLAALTHPAPAVRRSAAIALGATAPDTEAFLALSEASRLDPDPGVRAAAIRSLGLFGSVAVAPLRERLSDPESGVRLSAVSALERADRERAIVILGPLLGTPPHPAGIEAARVLARGDAEEDDDDDEDDQDAPPRGVIDGRAYLRRALLTGTPKLRAQAGVALISLPSDPALDRALEAALAAEKDPTAKLALASAMLRRPAMEKKAEKALEELLAGKAMPSVQAAKVLAARDHGGAVKKLETAIDHGASLERRVAARALARDAMKPDRVRQLLVDEDTFVRIYAAGGILAAVSAD